MRYPTIFALAFCAMVNGQTREVMSQVMTGPHQPLPGTERGYLYLIDQANVTLYAPQGFPVFTVNVTAPNGATPWADRLAIDSDGSLAVAVFFKTTGGYGSGIAFLDPAGRQTAFLETGLYSPSNLAYGDDHSLWAFGVQHDAASPLGESKQDYMMVRHYSADRTEAGRYLARSLFPPGVKPGVHSWDWRRIVAGQNKVGLLVWWANSESEWVELDMQGNLLRRVPIQRVAMNQGLAFTSDGRLYRQTSKELLVLDQNTPAWKAVTSLPGTGLCGADGNQLVFENVAPPHIVLQWFDQPSAGL